MVAYAAKSSPAIRAPIRPSRAWIRSGAGKQAAAPHRLPLLTRAVLVHVAAAARRHHQLRSGTNTVSGLFTSRQVRFTRDRLSWRSMESEALPRGDVALTSEEAELADRTVMVYGIPWDTSAEEMELWLEREARSTLGDALVCLKIRTFVGDDKALALSYPEHSKHTGYAHVALTSAEYIEDALATFRDLHICGRPLKAERAMDTRKLLPPYWIDTVGYAEQGEAWLAERAAQEAERLRKHQLQLRHNKSRRRRKREAHVEDLRFVLQPLRNPFTGAALRGTSPYAPIVPSAVDFSSCSNPFASESDGSGAAASTLAGLEDVNSWAAIWAAVPPACDPARGGLLCKKSAKRQDAPPTQVHPRAERKRIQVASFATVLWQLLGGWGQDRSAVEATIVDFGCGSGNLILPLASMFPKCTFIGVDMKRRSVELLNERARAAGLRNARGVVSTIAEYADPFHIALGLHACGSATDHAMQKAAEHCAAYLMVPCCVGKLKFELSNPVVMSNAQPTVDTAEEGEEEEEGGGGPRSAWLQEELSKAQFAIITRAADLSHSDGHGYSELAEAAKVCVELDRNRAMADMGYSTILTKLLGVEEGQFVNKSDFLVGIPRASNGAEFRWSW